MEFWYPEQIRPGAAESVLGTGRRCGPSGAGHVQSRKTLGGLVPAGDEWASAPVDMPARVSA
jgi:hypothetical protein